MSYQPKILAFAGSLRKDSYNKKLIQCAANAAREAGAEVTYIDLIDFQMPVYNGDIEAESGLPEAAIRLQELMLQHDGFLISTPEYNGSIPGAFKNVIDWSSRARGELPPGAGYAKKIASLMSASPGALGGLRSLTNVRAILSYMGVIVLPLDHALANAGDAFDETDKLIDARAEKQIRKLGTNLVEFLSDLH
ncbi:MAG: NADPH-dependent FMN reductase [Pyrinomonadaceae bacterium]